MKTLAYIPLHYGKEYLEYSIRSIRDHINHLIIVYTGSPSYGYNSNQNCPESEDELKEIAERVYPGVQWLRVNCGKGTETITRENQHREIVMRYAKDYDLVITIDSDEVWDPRILGETLETALQTDSRYIGIDGFVNFWRDFNHVVIDWFHPIRIHNMRSARTHQKDIKSTIYHFGYAQCREIMEYKFEVHGHRAEIFPHYVKDKFYAWKGIGCGVTRLHPASRDIWIDAEPYDKNQLPDLLKSHPNFEKQLI